MQASSQFRNSTRSCV